MIQQIIEAEMQKRKALKTVSVQNEHQQTVISSAYGYKCIKRFGLYNKKYESVKKNISKFTYELEEDYEEEEEEDNYDGEDEYPLESDFVNIITKQR